MLADAPCPAYAPLARHSGGGKVVDVDEVGVVAGVLEDVVLDVIVVVCVVVLVDWVVVVGGPPHV